MGGDKTKIIQFPKAEKEEYDEIFTLDESGDIKGALQCARKLIDEGYSGAYGVAGYFYERGGNGVEVNYDNAFFYYQKCIEDFGAVESYLALGRMYYFGKGVEPDFEAAFKYYEIVREDVEHPVAYLNLGKMYQNGDYVDKDYNKAEEYFLKAYEKSNILGLTYKALLEKERGNFLKSILLRIKAGFQASFTAIKEPDNDSYVRRW